MGSDELEATGIAVGGAEEEDYLISNAHPVSAFLFPPNSFLPPGLTTAHGCLDLDCRGLIFKPPATTSFGFVSAIVSSISDYNQRTSHPLLQHEYRSGEKGIEGGLEDAEMSRFLCSGPFPLLRFFSVPAFRPPWDFSVMLLSQFGFGITVVDFWVQVGSSSSAVAVFLVIFFPRSCGAFLCLEARLSHIAGEWSWKYLDYEARLWFRCVWLGCRVRVGSGRQVCAGWF
jgi:hypothetical protein